MTDREPRPPTRLQSVERACQLLLKVASMPEESRTVKNLVRELGTTVPAMYHLLNTLVDAGMLTRDEQRRYHLGVAVGQLAVAYYTQTHVSDELIAPLNGLIKATGETAYLSAWRNGDLEILAQMSGTHAVRVMDLGPGFHGGAHARASGKVLLAFISNEERNRYFRKYPPARITSRTIIQLKKIHEELEVVARRGYSTEEEEFREGVACLSVPIFKDGLLVGAYTISAPVDRYRVHGNEYLARLRAAARQAAGDISEDGLADEESAEPESTQA